MARIPEAVGRNSRTTSAPPLGDISFPGAVTAVVAAQRMLQTLMTAAAGADGYPGGGIGFARPAWQRSSSNFSRAELDPEQITFGALVHFTTHSALQNFIKPWQMRPPSAATGTGFCIGERRILTNSHVIHGGTSIRVERHGRSGNFAARVLCEGEMCDLALVTVDEDEFWEDLPSVVFQDEVPALDDTVIAVGYPLGATSITVTRGVVSNVQMKDLTLRGWDDEQQLLAVQHVAKTLQHTAQSSVPRDTPERAEPH